MKKRRSRNGLGALGGLEIEILPIVWKNSKVTVKDVFEEMYDQHKLAYTTIMTVMNRLAVKGVLKQNRKTVPYIYSAAISKQEMGIKMLDEVVSKILDGSSSLLAAYCLERGNVCEIEVETLRGSLAKCN